jgi:hypothetical protein
MLAGNQSTPCPAQSTTYDVYEGPSASASACSCGCSLTSQPGCPGGSIALGYDTNPGHNPLTCGSKGSALSTASGCSTDPFAGPGYLAIDMALTPPAATGGTCAASGVAAPGNLTYAATDRVCAPSTLPCTGDECRPSFPLGYAVCIVNNGVQACPGAPFTHQHVVGGAATFTCSNGSCSCQVETGTCTGTVTFYPNAGCTGTAMPVAADGQCRDPMFTSDDLPSYTYAANPLSPSCAAAGTSTAQNVALANPVTVCCAQ